VRLVSHGGEREIPLSEFYNNDGIAYMHRRPDEIVASVPAEYYGDDPTMYKVALLKNLEGYSPDGLFTGQGAQNVFKVLNAFEPAVQAAKIDLTRTYDNSYAQRALKKYK
jgi:NitT/TauT family transport system substrate-binding protein